MTWSRAKDLLLKAGATMLTLVAATGGAVYVAGHLKNPAAPLRPSVLGAASIYNAGSGRLILTPAVRSANVEAVTSTYAS